MVVVEGVVVEARPPLSPHAAKTNAINTSRFMP
jgi:hypothetical protein